MPVPNALGLTPKEWFVVFEPKTSIWWNRFLRPGFGHCFMFGYLPLEEGRGIYQFFEPLTTGGFMGVAPHEHVLEWRTRAALGQLRILQIEAPNVEAVRPRFMVTCAGAVGFMLGLPRLPVTPHGLYWMLRRRGAREIGMLPDGWSTESSSAGGADPGGAGAAAACGAGCEGCGGACACGEGAGGGEAGRRDTSDRGWPARPALTA
jgi:hypothetical protein